MAAPDSYDVKTIAKLLMLDVRRVQQLARDGWIPREGRGRYGLIPSVQGYIRFLRDCLERRSVDDGVIDLNKERARLTRYKADKEELELKAQQGELIPADLVEAAWVKILSWTRERLLTVPDLAAPRVLDADSIPEIREVLAEAVQEALEELSREPRYTPDDPGPPDAA